MALKNSYRYVYSYLSTKHKRELDKMASYARMTKAVFAGEMIVRGLESYKAEKLLRRQEVKEEVV